MIANSDKLIPTVSRDSSKKLITEVRKALNDLNEIITIKNLSKSDIVSYLKNYLTDFAHTETGKNLDQRM